MVTPLWLLDYFVINGFVDCKVYIELLARRRKGVTYSRSTSTRSMDPNSSVSAFVSPGDQTSRLKCLQKKALNRQAKSHSIARALSLIRIMGDLSKKSGCYSRKVTVLTLYARLVTSTFTMFRVPYFYCADDLHRERPTDRDQPAVILIALAHGLPVRTATNPSQLCA